VAAVVTISLKSQITPKKEVIFLSMFPEVPEAAMAALAEPASAAAAATAE